jgi:hypothetical protein
MKRGNSARYFIIPKNHKRRKPGEELIPMVFPESPTLLNSKKICVVGCPDFVQKVEGEISSHGGVPVKSPSDDTYAVIAEKRSLRADLLLKSGRWKVLKSSWLEKCIISETLDVENISQDDSWSLIS